MYKNPLVWPNWTEKGGIVPCVRNLITITVNSFGRLGNVMSQYATTYALARRYGYTPYIKKVFLLLFKEIMSLLLKFLMFKGAQTGA